MRRLTRDELKELREDINLGSIYLSDYKNKFGFSPDKVCEFFDGFIDYCDEKMYDEQGEVSPKVYFSELAKYDTLDNLEAWYNVIEDTPLMVEEDNA